MRHLRTILPPLSTLAQLLQGDQALAFLIATQFPYHPHLSREPTQNFPLVLLPSLLVALVTDEKSDHLPKVSMKPWEGWRIVFLGSCRVVTILVKYRPLTIARAQHIASLLPCFGEYLEHTRLGFLRQFCSGSSNPDRRNLTHSSLLVREFANPLFSID